jgi:hypothetical protein
MKTNKEHSYDAVKLHQMGYKFVGDGSDIIRLTDVEVTALAIKCKGTVVEIETARMCD